MATIVTGEQYRKLDVKLEEIKRQIRQKRGYPFDPSALEYALQVIIEGRFGDLGVSAWSVLFGHLRIWDSSFNESNFPLGADPGDEAEEFGLNQLVTGYEAIREFEQIKRRPASLWAQGRYIKTNTMAQKDHILVGIGAPWQGRGGDVWFPLFLWVDGKPLVGIRSLDYEFEPAGCRFLLSKEERV